MPLNQYLALPANANHPIRERIGARNREQGQDFRVIALTTILDNCLYPGKYDPNSDLRFSDSKEITERAVYAEKTMEIIRRTLGSRAVLANQDDFVEYINSITDPHQYNRAMRLQRLLSNDLGNDSDQDDNPQLVKTEIDTLYDQIRREDEAMLSQNPLDSGILEKNLAYYDDGYPSVEEINRRRTIDDFNNIAEIKESDPAKWQLQLTALALSSSIPINTGTDVRTYVSELRSQGLDANSLTTDFLDQIWPRGDNTVTASENESRTEIESVIKPNLEKLFSSIGEGNVWWELFERFKFESAQESTAETRQDRLEHFEQVLFIATEVYSDTDEFNVPERYSETSNPRVYYWQSYINQILTEEIAPETAPTLGEIHSRVANAAERPSDYNAEVVSSDEHYGTELLDWRVDETLSDYVERIFSDEYVTPRDSEGNPIEYNYLNLLVSETPTFQERLNLASRVVAHLLEEENQQTGNYEGEIIGVEALEQQLRRRSELVAEALRIACIAYPQLQDGAGGDLRNSPLIHLALIHDSYEDGVLDIGQVIAKTYQLLGRPNPESGIELLVPESNVYYSFTAETADSDRLDLGKLRNLGVNFDGIYDLSTALETFRDSPISIERVIDHDTSLYSLNLPAPDGNGGYTLEQKEIFTINEFEQVCDWISNLPANPSIDADGTIQIGQFTRQDLPLTETALKTDALAEKFNNLLATEVAALGETPDVYGLQRARFNAALKAQTLLELAYEAIPPTEVPTNSAQREAVLAAITDPELYYAAQWAYGSSLETNEPSESDAPDEQDAFSTWVAKQLAGDFDRQQLVEIYNQNPWLADIGIGQWNDLNLIFNTQGEEIVPTNTRQALVTALYEKGLQDLDSSGGEGTSESTELNNEELPIPLTTEEIIARARVLTTAVAKTMRYIPEGEVDGTSTSSDLTTPSLNRALVQELTILRETDQALALIGWLEASEIETLPLETPPGDANSDSSELDTRPAINDLVNQDYIATATTEISNLEPINHHLTQEVNSAMQRILENWLNHYRTEIATLASQENGELQNSELETTETQTEPISDEQWQAARQKLEQIFIQLNAAAYQAGNRSHLLQFYYNNQMNLSATFNNFFSITDDNFDISNINFRDFVDREFTSAHTASQNSEES